MRVAGGGLRVAGGGLREAGGGLRGARCGSRDAGGGIQLITHHSGSSCSRPLRGRSLPPWRRKIRNSNFEIRNKFQAPRTQTPAGSSCFFAAFAIFCSIFVSRKGAKETWLGLVLDSICLTPSGPHPFCERSRRAGTSRRWPRKSASPFRLPSSVFRLPSSVFDLRPSTFDLRPSLFPLPSKAPRGAGAAERGSLRRRGGAAAAGRTRWPVWRGGCRVGRAQQSGRRGRCDSGRRAR